MVEEIIRCGWRELDDWSSASDVEEVDDDDDEMMILDEMMMVVSPWRT